MVARQLAYALALTTLVACSDGTPAQFTTDAATDGADASMGCTSAAQCDDGVACTRDLCVVGGQCEHVPDGPSCVVPQRCARQADCDDRVACTRDTCLVDGTCAHTAQNDMCPAMQTCDTTRGCVSGTTSSGCRTDADCADAFACTLDTCGADGRCVYTAQNSRCASGEVCRAGMGCIRERTCSSDMDCDDRLRCNGAERCVEFGCVAGTAPSCDDMDACTTDTCAETGTMCSHAPVASCMGSAPRSGRYTLSPGVTYSCSSLLGMEVLNLSLTFVQITVTTSGITVVGGPTMMTGPAPSGGMFTASGTVAGDCAETYTLAGRFTDATHFTGTFTTAFAGLTCGITNCMGRTFPVAGTLAM